MKKLTTLLVLFFLAVGLFAEPVIIPKNYDFLEIDNSIRYCDDNIENSYKLYSVVYKTDVVNLTSLHSIKTSLVSNVEISITLKFDTEEELDDFIDYFYYTYNYTIKNTPVFFDALKDFTIDLGVEPLYVMDKDDKPKQILYIANLTRN